MQEEGQGWGRCGRLDQQRRQAARGAGDQRPPPAPACAPAEPSQEGSTKGRAVSKDIVWLAVSAATDAKGQRGGNGAGPPPSSDRVGALSEACHRGDQAGGGLRQVVREAQRRS